MRHEWIPETPQAVALTLRAIAPSICITHGSTHTRHEWIPDPSGSSTHIECDSTLDTVSALLALVANGREEMDEPSM